MWRKEIAILKNPIWLCIGTYLTKSFRSISGDSVAGTACKLAEVEVSGMDSAWDRGAL